jgi:hypothetical protein
MISVSLPSDCHWFLRGFGNGSNDDPSFPNIDSLVPNTGAADGCVKPKVDVDVPPKVDPPNELPPKELNPVFVDPPL